MIRITAGQLFVSKDDTITTLVACCGSLVLWDTVEKIGGLNHYQFPYQNKRGYDSSTYLNEMLIMILKDFNCKNLVGRLYGCACKTDTIKELTEKNIEVGLKALKKHDIPLIEKDTGGAKYRNIKFNCLTGEVIVKFIKE